MNKFKNISISIGCIATIILIGPIASFLSIDDFKYAPLILLILALISGGYSIKSYKNDNLKLLGGFMLLVSILFMFFALVAIYLSYTI